MPLQILNPARLAERLQLDGWILEPRQALRLADSIYSYLGVERIVLLTRQAERIIADNRGDIEAAVAAGRMFAAQHATHELLNREIADWMQTRNLSGYINPGITMQSLDRIIREVVALSMATREGVSPRASEFTGVEQHYIIPPEVDNSGIFGSPSEGGEIEMDYDEDEDHSDDYDDEEHEGEPEEDEPEEEPVERDEQRER